MIIEYRLKRDCCVGNLTDCNWNHIHPDAKYDEIPWDSFSIRINKVRIYNVADTKGFKEEFNKVITWMKLSGDYDGCWKPW